METIQISDERPATCFCCKKQLYFIGDSRHEPEYKLIIKDHLKPHPNTTTYFIHADCWTITKVFYTTFSLDVYEKESS